MTTISNFDQIQVHGSDALQGSEMPVPENNFQGNHFSTENIRLYRVAADHGAAMPRTRWGTATAPVRV